MEWRKPLNTAVLEKDTSDDDTRRHPDARKDICGDVGLVSGVLEMGGIVSSDDAFLGCRTVNEGLFRIVFPDRLLAYTGLCDGAPRFRRDLGLIGEYVYDWFSNARVCT